LGLKSGSYDVKITGQSSGETATVNNLAVSSYNRSGYAHFGSGYSGGVGAYNDDGTLKANTVVVTVDDATKNTVTATLGGKSYTGLVAILQAQSKSSYPLDVRIKGVITTNQFQSKTISSGKPYDDPTYYENSLETKYAENLKGLTVKAMGSSNAETYWNKTANACSSSGYVFAYNKVTATADTDSYFNMCDVSGAANVTVEGITADAALEQWGFTWSKGNSIEVRNLLFENNVEDACSFQGGSNTNMDFHNFWLHHCRFNRGLNHWDLTYEQDKGDGDGEFDIKFLHNITSDHNIFYNCHKTGLIGGSDKAYTENVTFHHNKYWKCSSRLPLGRQANMHFYNNYYLDCTTCQDIRANAYCFSEANYFSGCKNPQLVTNDSTYKGTAIKSFGDVLVSCGTSKATVVTDRSKEVTNSCKPDGTTDYSSFTTSSSLFYYDTTTKKSSVSLLLEAKDVPTYVEANAGVFSY